MLGVESDKGGKPPGTVTDVLSLVGKTLWSGQAPCIAECTAEGESEERVNANDVQLEIDHPVCIEFCGCEHACELHS